MSTAPAGTVLVVGTGLIGTSIGLGLRAQGWTVHLHDADPVAAREAEALGAGLLGEPSAADSVDVVVVSVPPRYALDVISAALRDYPQAVVTDVTSVKSGLVDAVASGTDADRFVGGHPLAGREVSGPSGALPDLFEGRPWVLTPGDATSADAVARIRTIAEALGARVSEMDAPTHDRAVALVSHVPQIVASAAAARLLDGDDVSVTLAGQGVRDVTRIAASDPEMWVDILQANSGAVSTVLSGVIDDLVELQGVLNESADSADVRDLLVRGNQGRARIPGKHGRRAQDYVEVGVVIPDEPRGLASLFDLVADAGINVEDLALEHSPAQPTGVVTVSVLPSKADELTDALRARGWTVHR